MWVLDQLRTAVLMTHVGAEAIPVETGLHATLSSNSNVHGHHSLFSPKLDLPLNVMPSNSEIISGTDGCFTFFLHCDVNNVPHS